MPLRYADIARHARENDERVKEFGFESLFEQYGVDLNGALGAREQRALRLAMMLEGREDELVTDQARRVQLSDEQRQNMRAYEAVWLDGFCVGLLSGRDSSPREVNIADIKR